MKGFATLWSVPIIMLKNAGENSILTLVQEDYSEINSLRSTRRRPIRRVHTSVKTCNQTGPTAIRHWQSTNTITHTQTLMLWPRTQRWAILSAGARHFKKRKKKERQQMIVCCSQSRHSDTRVPRNIKEE